MLGSSKKTKLTGAVLAALPLLAAASTTPHPITKVHGGRANKMAYGEPVPSHMDYLVDVGVERYSLGGTAHCTGTLIEPGYILTTAGCFVDDYGTTDASSIKIRLDNGRETITPNVVSLHVPEEYVPYAQSEKELFFGDIAVLYVPELDAPQYSDVNFPRLPEDRAEVDDSPALVSAGYGEDESFNYGEAEFISVQIGGSLERGPRTPISISNRITLLPATLHETTRQALKIRVAETRVRHWPSRARLGLKLLSMTRR